MLGWLAAFADRELSMHDHQTNGITASTGSMLCVAYSPLRCCIEPSLEELWQTLLCNDSSLMAIQGECMLHSPSLETFT